MGTLITGIANLLASLNDWRDKWLQSKLREYIRDFRKRSTEHKEYWYEKIAELLFGNLVNKGIVTVPNLISIFRGLMAFPLLIFILDERYLIALIFFIFIMLLDAVDGPLARVLDQESDLGEMLDPAGDKLVFAVIFLTLGLEYLKPWVFCTTFVLEISTVFLALCLRPIAKKLQLAFKKKSTLAGKIKLCSQVMGCGFLILHHLTKSSLLPVANTFFIASLPFSAISILTYFLTIQKRPE